MSYAEAVEIRHRNRIRGDGRYCLACGEPLFGPELLHARSLADRNLMDAIRYAGLQPEGKA